MAAHLAKMLASLARLSSSRDPCRPWAGGMARCGPLDARAPRGGGRFSL